MTVGAAGGLNVVLKAILDANSEVIFLAPFFPEYNFYIDNHGGKSVIVNSNSEFQPDTEKIYKAITPKTKAIIINTPNNPTGVVYTKEKLNNLCEVIKKRETEFNTEIYLINDAPYQKLVYDIDSPPSIYHYFKNSIMITSHSKDLALPGERIGYIAIHPDIADCNKLIAAMTFTNRTLGYVNAPALMQQLVGQLQNVNTDIRAYKKKRDLFVTNLSEMGYNLITPQGAFYLYPEAPGEDDIKFTNLLKKFRILVVPGTGFGTPGYFRIAYCVDDKTIKDSFEGFRSAMKEIKS